MSLARVGTVLLGTEGIFDYSTLTLNGSSANITLTEEEIPVFGSVELEV